MAAEARKAVHDAVFHSALNFNDAPLGNFDTIAATALRVSRSGFNDRQKFEDKTGSTYVSRV